VIGWAYALGSVFALTNDAVFREVLRRARFARQVARLNEAYCVVCGYGRSGEAMVQALDALGIRTVVIETDPTRLEHIVVRPFKAAPLHRVGDARRPDVLREAGIARAACHAVIVLTSDDSVNLEIALNVRALAPETHVIARIVDVASVQTVSELARIEVIDPYATFADDLCRAIVAPEVLHVEDWLTASQGTTRPPMTRLPHGCWVLAGEAIFENPIARALTQAGQQIRSLEIAIDAAGTEGLPSAGYQAIDAGLRDCRIEQACGLVAGTVNDTVNLTLTTLARQANPDVAVVIRQRKSWNQPLMDAARPERRFVQSTVMVHEILQGLVTPLLNRFLAALRQGDRALSGQAIECLEACVGNEVPLVWTLRCDVGERGLRDALAHPDDPLRIWQLLRDPRDARTPLAATPLMLLRVGVDSTMDDGQAWQASPQSIGRVRAGRRVGLLDRASTFWGAGYSAHEAHLMLPDLQTALLPGDTLLFAGRVDAHALQSRVLEDPLLLEFVRTGKEPPRSLLFRWWARRHAAPVV
jgi:Trk K+ transport system NAD-binding subunit